MATKKSGRAGGFPPVRPNPEAPATPLDPQARVESLVENSLREETKVMPSYGTRTQPQTEGVTVIGEAVRRILSESAEVIIEITSAAPTAAPAAPRHQPKKNEDAQAGSPVGGPQGEHKPSVAKVHNPHCAGNACFTGR